MRSANGLIFRSFLESAIDFTRGCYGILIPNGWINKSSCYIETSLHKQSLGGWYNNPQKLLLDVKRISEVNAYLTPNPLTPDLLSIRPNTLDILRPHPLLDDQSGAGDRHVLTIDYLFIDIDSVRSRPPGATDAEHAAALALRDAILDGENLRDHAYWGSSGNGGWILLKVSGAPNTPELVATHKQFLDKLASKYGRAGLSPVFVDTNTANPFRPLPIPGTWKCKRTNDL